MLFKEKVWHKFTGICPKVEMLECYEISLYNFIVFFFTFLQWKCNWSQVYKIPCFHLDFFVYNLFQDAKIEMDILPSEMYLSTTMLYQIFCVNFLKKRLCQRRSSFVIIRVLQGCVLPETVLRKTYLDPCHTLRLIKKKWLLLNNFTDLQWVILNYITQNTMKRALIQLPVFKSPLSVLCFKVSFKSWLFFLLFASDHFSSPQN